MSIPVPEIPHFSDDYNEKPISEMEKLIAQTIAERNYDIERIHKNTASTVATNEGAKWLISEETSVKIKPPQQKPADLQTIRYIKIGEEVERKDTVIHLTPEPIIPANNNSFFQKLKLKEPVKKPEPVKEPVKELAEEITELKNTIHSLQMQQQNMNQQLNEILQRLHLQESKEDESND